MGFAKNSGDLEQGKEKRKKARKMEFYAVFTFLIFGGHSEPETVHLTAPQAQAKLG